LALGSEDPDRILAALCATGRVPEVLAPDVERACAAVLRYVRTSRDGCRLASTKALALCDGVLALSRDPSGRIQHDTLQLAIEIAGKNMVLRARYIGEVLNRDGAPEGHDGESLPREVQVSDGYDLAGRILAARGCVLVRGLLDPEALKLVKRAADKRLRTYGVRALKAAKVCEPASVISRDVREFLERMLTPFFHAPATLRWDHSYLRRVEPRVAGTRVPFHQDLNAFGLMLANVWTPLVNCGIDAPGLEVVARRIREIAPTLTASNSYPELEIAESVVLERFGADALWAPAMACGDVLVMLGTTIHRTYWIRGVTRQRTSLELRFGPSANGEATDARA
jgi:hypothetical protein